MFDVKDPAWLARERPLCERAKRGEQGAFAELYTTFAFPLYESLARSLRTRAEAEDAVAESFRKAFEKIADFSGDGSIWFWIHEIGVNEARMINRKKVRSGRAFNGWGHLVGQSHTPDLDRELDRPKELQRLNTTMAMMPDDYQRALKLRKLEERSREECAAAFGSSVPAFDMLISRALKLLRTKWEEKP
ncbi:MAG: RNA polymerase sigma factor [Deltaproteobacteria bacterium]|nr:RNA polymerase sigma factor [Deltaproteobacteria bacterium]